jgi:hypothetical protein
MFRIDSPRTVAENGYMKLVSKVHRMPSHLAFFAEKEGSYLKVMVKRSGRVLEISLGSTDDYGSYEKFVIMISKFVPAQFFLLEPVPLQALDFETVTTTARDAGILE